MREVLAINTGFLCLVSPPDIHLDDCRIHLFLDAKRMYRQLAKKTTKRNIFALG
jgi:hypothetical protein